MTFKTITLVAFMALASTSAFAFSFGSGETIDFSSDANFASSIVQMHEGMTEAEKEEFSLAMVNLIIDSYPPAKDNDPMSRFIMFPSAKEYAKSVGLVLTKEAILERVQLDKSPQTPELRDQVLACIKERVIVSDIKITQEYLTVVTAKITNNLPWAISRISADYEYKSDSRSVPWSDGEAGALPKGGIEPGETVETQFFMIDLPEVLDESAKLSLEVANVFDQDQVPLIVSPLGGAKPSDRRCE
ncbi:hypothetical protein [Cereibacter changlensis]|uniref:hypothetical protein n=1 Tax=Cereibacter changlensis TaxID=402884 RepID=UPI0040347C22